MPTRGGDRPTLQSRHRKVCKAKTVSLRALGGETSDPRTGPSKAGYLVDRGREGPSCYHRITSRMLHGGQRPSSRPTASSPRPHRPAQAGVAYTLGHGAAELGQEVAEPVSQWAARSRRARRCCNANRTRTTRPRTPAITCAGAAQVPRGSHPAVELVRSASTAPACAQWLGPSRRCHCRGWVRNVEFVLISAGRRAARAVQPWQRCSRVAPTPQVQLDRTPASTRRSSNARRSGVHAGGEARTDGAAARAECRAAPCRLGPSLKPSWKVVRHPDSALRRSRSLQETGQDRAQDRTGVVAIVRTGDPAYGHDHQPPRSRPASRSRWRRTGRRQDRPTSSARQGRRPRERRPAACSATNGSEQMATENPARHHRHGRQAWGRRRSPATVRRHRGDCGRQEEPLSRGDRRQARRRADGDHASAATSASIVRRRARLAGPAVTASRASISWCSSTACGRQRAIGGRGRGPLPWRQRDARPRSRTRFTIGQRCRAWFAGVSSATGARVGLRR